MIIMVGMYTGQLTQRPALHPGPTPCECVYHAEFTDITRAKGNKL